MDLKAKGHFCQFNTLINPNILDILSSSDIFGLKLTNVLVFFFSDNLDTFVYI